MLNILLIEDDLDIAAGIGDYLQAQQMAVEFAYNAAQARERIRNAAFDLLVLDINLPDQDGISLCEELKTQWQLSQPIIFLTARSHLDDKLAGFSAGAVDYMVKPFALAELHARIKALTAHIPASGSGVICVEDWRLQIASGLISRGAQTLQLSATAAQLLQKLMLAHPATVSRNELQTTVWGNELPDSDPLRAHIYELRHALIAQFNCAPIITVRGIGYRFGEPA